MKNLNTKEHSILSLQKLAQDAKKEVEEKATAKLHLRTANLAARGVPCRQTHPLVPLHVCVSGGWDVSLSL